MISKQHRNLSFPSPVCPSVRSSVRSLARMLVLHVALCPVSISLCRFPSDTLMSQLTAGLLIYKFAETIVTHAEAQMRHDAMRSCQSLRPSDRNKLLSHNRESFENKL